jgi:hypothetical protein
MKTDIEIVRGTTNTFDITVTDAFGQLYTLSANETLLFGVKRTPEDIDYIFVKSVKVGDKVLFHVWDELPTYDPDVVVVRENSLLGVFEDE